MFDAFMLLILNVSFSNQTENEISVIRSILLSANCWDPQLRYNRTGRFWILSNILAQNWEF
jgi:hypothetical protein